MEQLRKRTDHRELLELRKKLLDDVSDLSEVYKKLGTIKAMDYQERKEFIRITGLIYTLCGNMITRIDEIPDLAEYQGLERAEIRRKDKIKRFKPKVISSGNNR